MKYIYLLTLIFLVSCSKDVQIGDRVIILKIEKGCKGDVGNNEYLLSEYGSRVGFIQNDVYLCTKQRYYIGDTLTIGIK
jgi:hypothetical protein